MIWSGADLTCYPLVEAALGNAASVKNYVYLWIYTIKQHIVMIWVNKLYREIIDPDDCQEIQEDLNTLSAWFKIWLLRFNETKCIVLRIRFV
jgi:hypothetical protein